KNSTQRLAAYDASHGIQAAQQGGGDAGAKGGPSDQTAAPVQVGKAGKDTQIPAGATPAELGTVNIAHFKANEGSVRQLFKATLGARGRAGLQRNQLI